MVWSPNSKCLVHSTLEGPEGILQPHWDVGTWELTFILCVQGIGFYSTLWGHFCIDVKFSSILFNHFNKDRVCRRTAKKSALDSTTEVKLICLWKVTGSSDRYFGKLSCWAIAEQLIFKYHVLECCQKIAGPFCIPSWLLLKTGKMFA